MGSSQSTQLRLPRGQNALGSDMGAQRNAGARGETHTPWEDLAGCCFLHIMLIIMVDEIQLG